MTEPPPPDGATPPAAPKASHRTGCLGKSCCGCAVGAAVLLALFMIMSMVSSRSSRPVADAFLAAIRDGDMARAYSLASDEMRKVTTEDDLTTFSAVVGKSAGKLVSFQHQGLFTQFNIFGGAMVRHDYSAVFAQDRGRVSVAVIRENMQWAVLRFEFNSPKIGVHLGRLAREDLSGDDAETTR